MGLRKRSAIALGGATLLIAAAVVAVQLSTTITRERA